MSDTIKNSSSFPMGNQLSDMFSKYFIGQAYLQPLTEKGGPISNVTYEPGCRNNWHIHHGTAKDSWFSHLAVEVSCESGSNEWCEPQLTSHAAAKEGA